jgi:adenine-specific DNA-methyltransferase
MIASEALLERADRRRIDTLAALDAKRKAALGQFFTHVRAAEIIAGMARLSRIGRLRVLDPGAGSGSLCAALVARIIREAPELDVEIVAVELDDAIIPALTATLGDCATAAASAHLRLRTNVVCGDYVRRPAGLSSLDGPFARSFDLVIMNPPYRKISAVERDMLGGPMAACPNLYAAFLAGAVESVRPGGQVVAITPRSFANGPYFGAFRRSFLGRVALDRLHVFESRGTVFADTGVLQENIIFSATKGVANESVVLSVSRGHLDEAGFREVPYAQVVDPADQQQFVRVVALDGDAEASDLVSGLPASLASIGLAVSTGRVVDFRARAFLREEPGDNTAPLVYPGNLKHGQVRWPRQIRKPQALVVAPETTKLLLPDDTFVVVKRFSAKEERRRVVAAVYTRSGHASGVAFENHLNVIHMNGAGLSGPVARGICLWLNSTVLDRHFRTFSGHTQVNATDLRSLPYPTQEQLLELAGHWSTGPLPEQSRIDDVVSGVVAGSAETGLERSNT